MSMFYPFSPFAVCVVVCLSYHLSIVLSVYLSCSPFGNFTMSLKIV